MKKSGTVNRGWLKRQIQNGNIEIKCDMILTDDYAFDNSSNCQKSGWEKADIKNFTEQDFKYKSGYARWNEDGTISWTMLCNHYYTCRLINQEPEKAFCDRNMKGNHKGMKIASSPLLFSIN